MEKQQQQSADQAPLPSDSSFEELWELFSQRLLSDAFLDTLVLAIKNRRRTLLPPTTITNGINHIFTLFELYFTK